MKTSGSICRKCDFSGTHFRNIGTRERRVEGVTETSENHDENEKCQDDIRRRHYNPSAWCLLELVWCHLSSDICKGIIVGSVSNFDGKGITSLSNQN